MHRLSFQSHWTGDSFILQITNNKRTLTIIPLNLKRLTLSLNLTRQMGERKQKKKAKQYSKATTILKNVGISRCMQPNQHKREQLYLQAFFFFGTHSEQCLFTGNSSLPKALLRRSAAPETGPIQTKLLTLSSQCIYWFQ